MKKLLLSTLILSSGLMFALPVHRRDGLANAQPTNTTSAPATQQATSGQNSYLSDLGALDKDLQDAIKNGSVNPTQPQEDALKTLNDKLTKFIAEYCPLNNGKYTLNGKISAEDAINILNKYETFVQGLHTALSANDSAFVILYPQLYSAKAKKAYAVIKNIRIIKNDITPPSLYGAVTNKLNDGKKWVLSSKTNFAMTVAGAMALSATARFALKDHNAWIKPVINSCAYVGSNVIHPTIKYVTWDLIG